MLQPAAMGFDNGLHRFEPMGGRRHGNGFGIGDLVARPVSFVFRRAIQPGDTARRHAGKFDAHFGAALRCGQCQTQAGLRRAQRQQVTEERAQCEGEAVRIAFEHDRPGRKRQNQGFCIVAGQRPPVAEEHLCKIENGVLEQRLCLGIVGKRNPLIGKVGGTDAAYRKVDVLGHR